MRIVMTSHSYAPNVGGIETVGLLLAQGLRVRGHELIVLTGTPAAESDPMVLRRPDLRAAWRAMRWAEVVLQSNISLRWLWLPLLMRKPVVVVSHTWLRRPDGHLGWQDHLKRWALQRVRISAAVSAVLARHIGANCRVVPNPYDGQLFQRPAPDLPGRRGGLVFLGRLVSDKGCDLAIATLAALRAQGLDLHLTVIGTGPETRALQLQAKLLGVVQYVIFKGVLRGAALVQEMQRHRVLLACSRWEEPFGLVALEALASGLVPVVPNRGGLPEATGEFGCTYEHDCPASLLAATRRALERPTATPAQMASLDAHLARHQSCLVVGAYELLLQEASGQE